MTRQDIIAFGTKKYGKKFIAALARDMRFSVSSVMRVVTGETPVSRRMELEMEKLIRQHRFEALARPDVRY